MNHGYRNVKYLLRNSQRRTAHHGGGGEQQIDPPPSLGEQGSGNPLRGGSRVPEADGNQTLPFPAVPRVPASYEQSESVLCARRWSRPLAE